jgi:hypothetical protein
LAAGEFSSGGGKRCSASTLTSAAAGDFCSNSFPVAAGGDRNSASFFIGGGDEDCCPVTSLTVGDVGSSLSPSAPSLHVSDHKICCFFILFILRIV